MPPIPPTEHPAVFSIPAECIEFVEKKNLCGFKYNFHDDVLYLRVEAKIGDVGRLQYNNGSWSFTRN